MVQTSTINIQPQRLREDLKGKSLPHIAHELLGLSNDVVEQVDLEAREKHVGFLEASLERKLINNQQVAHILAAHLGLPFIESIDVENIPDELLNVVPILFAKQNRLLPIGNSADDRSFDRLFEPPLVAMRRRITGLHSTRT